MLTIDMLAIDIMKILDLLMLDNVLESQESEIISRVWQLHSSKICLSLLEDVRWDGAHYLGLESHGTLILLRDG